jgi:hypothetical protein
VERGNGEGKWRGEMERGKGEGKGEGERGGGGRKGEERKGGVNLIDCVSILISCSLEPHLTG